MMGGEQRGRRQDVEVKSKRGRCLVSKRRGCPLQRRDRSGTGRADVKIEPGFTSETSETKKKTKQKTNHLDSRADGMNLEIYVVYQKLHQQRL